MGKWAESPEEFERRYRELQSLAQPTQDRSARSWTRRVAERRKKRRKYLTWRRKQCQKNQM
jgi:hypothetical protein